MFPALGKVAVNENPTAIAASVEAWLPNRFYTRLNTVVCGLRQLCAKAAMKHEVIEFFKAKSVPLCGIVDGTEELELHKAISEQRVLRSGKKVKYA